MWEPEEIKGYTPIGYDPLERLYQANNLPADNPEARAKSLSEKVLILTATDHDIIMRKAKENGKPAALFLLETMVRASHQAHIEKVKESEKTIPVPLP